MREYISLDEAYHMEKNKAATFLDWEEEWDGYSAKKIDKEDFKKQIFMFDLCLKAGLPMPKLIPNSNGEIEITWSNKDKDAYIMYEKEEGYHFFYMDKNGFNYIEESVNEKDAFLKKEFIFYIRSNFSLSEMYKSILRLDTLKDVKDNWDGKSALAMKEKTYNNALLFIKSKFEDNYGIFLNPEGEVVIDFVNSENLKNIGVEIGENIWRIYDYEKDTEMVFNNSVSFLGRMFWLVRK